MTASVRRIVVGIVPRQAADVLSAAAMFARRFGAELVCAHVDPSRYTAAFDPDGTPVSLPRVPDGSEGRKQLLDPELSDTIAATLTGTGVSWSAHALAGHPARELELLADRVGALMIVVGTRDPGARETLRELFNGSVADRLVHRQRRPVVVVPANPVLGDDADPVVER